MKFVFVLIAMTLLVTTAQAQQAMRDQIAAIQSRANYAKTLMAAESAAGTFLPLHGFDPADGISGNLWKVPAAK
jgi:uncharacterized membrane protein